MSSDVEMLAAWRQGDRGAADALLERHFASLCRFFRNKVDIGVEDLIQRTLLTCVERRDRIPDGWCFRTFLFVVARDQLYMHYRAQRRSFNATQTSVADLSPSPSTIVAKRQEHALVLQALRELPMQTQVLLELRYWEGMTGPQLARILSISEGTVRSRLRLAKERLFGSLSKAARIRGLVVDADNDFEAWARDVQATIAG
ncbi:MAG: RNA polymerase sigma factor [Nannocystales bacterium]